MQIPKMYFFMIDNIAESLFISMPFFYKDTEKMSCCTLSTQHSMTLNECVSGFCGAEDISVNLLNFGLSSLAHMLGANYADVSVI